STGADRWEAPRSFGPFRRPWISTPPPAPPRPPAAILAPEAPPFGPRSVKSPPTAISIGPPACSLPPERISLSRSITRFPPTAIRTEQGSFEAREQVIFPPGVSVRFPPRGRIPLAARPRPSGGRSGPR